MAYLGLVPAEHSSGTKMRRRGITKAGNALGDLGVMCAKPLPTRHPLSVVARWWLQYRHSHREVLGNLLTR
jgi:hypothetical protein